MNGMNHFIGGIERREFIRSLGALALAFAGQQIFAAPSGWKMDGKPNLVFGVLSDTHLRTKHGRSTNLGHNWPSKYFEAALNYFKSQNVDAVMHCGDWAHRGQVAEIVFHARVWNKVFPKNRAPDGHEVVKLFVTGNHDTDGANYGGFVKGKYPDPKEFAKHVLNTDMAANWERIWGEKYEKAWHKEVKGYHFFGLNYGVDLNELSKCISQNAGSIASNNKTKRPFFFVQHRRPLGGARALLGKYSSANPMAFFGHNHWSAASWNIPSIYKGGLLCLQTPSCEPRGCAALVGDSSIAKVQPVRTPQTSKGRQGYLVKVYDDVMVIERHEFALGGKLGADWVIPLGKRAIHPLAKSELLKVIGKPEFKSNAKLLIEPYNPPSSGTAQASQSSQSLIRVSIPLADGNPNARVYAYELTVTGVDSSKKLYKAVYSAGVNIGAGHEPNGGVTWLDINKSELPRGKQLTFSVRPLTSLGTSGAPINAVYG